MRLSLYLTLLHLAEKRQRERRRSRDTRTGSTTPPIPEEPEDVPSDSGYMSGDSLSPPERQQHPAASIHRKHAPPSRPDTRTSTGFKEPPVSWHHDGPAIAVGGAQYPGAYPYHICFSSETQHPYIPVWQVMRNMCPVGCKLVYMASLMDAWPHWFQSLFWSPCA